MVWRRAGSAAAIAASAVIVVVAQTRDVRPVTAAVLANPGPNDWVAWRGTGRSQGYSPLSQIHRGNVGGLQLAWSWAMEPGTQQSAPLVYDGVMYLPNPGGILQALDAATGDLRWEFKTEVAATAKRPTGITRGLAMFDDKVFMTTLDGGVIAVNARTGQQAWRTQVARGGFRITAGPVVANGTVTAALSGCDRFVEEKCAIVGLDASTGKELWRTPTIPSPGEPGHESWGTVEPVYRAGADMWISGSDDAELNLVYWSTAQPKPWARFARGTDADSLYSSSTLALDPATGRIVWHRQTIPGETHDLDEAFESVLVDVGTRKSLFKIGKIGILWEIDRRSGAIVRATDLGYQNLLIVDPKSGAVRYREEKIPKPGIVLDQCPGSFGIKNWPSMAYSPETQALYIPHMTACGRQTYTTVEMTPGGGGLGFGKIDWYLPPEAGGNVGGLTAITVDGRVLWQYRQRAPIGTAALTTAGGLVFAGGYDRYFRAFDVKTGQELWHVRAPTSVQGFPVSYGVGGRQYLAVPVGTGGPLMAPDQLRNLVAGLPVPRPGNSIMVFALPR